jgi:hypothetical protein
MSLDIHWDRFNAAAADRFRAYLNDFFCRLDSLPDFIGPIHVKSFSFGSSPPEVCLLDISDPNDEFYVEGSFENRMVREFMRSQESYGSVSQTGSVASELSVDDVVHEPTSSNTFYRRTPQPTDCQVSSFCFMTIYNFIHHGTIGQSACSIPW